MECGQYRDASKLRFLPIITGVQTGTRDAEVFRPDGLLRLINNGMLALQLLASKVKSALR